MHRREFVCTVSGLLLAGRAFAHHGWASFDETRPLYLEGTVRSGKWQNPHAEILVELAPSLALPAGLAKQAVPKQTQAVDGEKILAAAALPRNRGTWLLELSPLTRIEAWKLTQPKAGDRIAAVGYTFKNEAKHDGRHVMRVEYLIVGERWYGLRSMPV